MEGNLFTSNSDTMSMNKNSFWGAFLCIISVIFLIILMDLCIGSSSAWLYHRSRYGIFHRQQYVLNKANEDIIILGSSRASHHYIPDIFTDSLGLSCYNAGSEGMCIYYHYAMLAGMIERGHCPKMVIYEAFDNDVKECKGALFTLEAAIDRLAPHYGEFSCIDSVFCLNGWKELLKLHSLSYRYNSKLVQSIKCNFFPEYENNGYEAVYEVMPDSTIMRPEVSGPLLVDSLKVNYLNKLISLTKKNDIMFVMVVSPEYVKGESEAYMFIEELANSNGIDFYYFRNEPSLMQTKYFKDKAHMNDEGAKSWSKFIAHLLKNKKQSISSK